jgi:hypothetical protein
MTEVQRRRAAAKRQRRENRHKLWSKRHPGRMKASSSHTAFQRDTTRRGLHNGRNIIAWVLDAYRQSRVEMLLEEGQQLVDEARGKAE